MIIGQPIAVGGCGYFKVRPGRWVLTGSHNLSLRESVGQSLAGRTAVAHLLPLARTEVRRFARHPRAIEEAVLSGGYPAIYEKRLSAAHLVIQTADRLTVVEVKASATITADMIAGPARVAAILAAAGRVQAAAVHAGTMRQNRTEASAIPWESVADMLE